MQNIITMDVLSAVSEKEFSLDELVIATKTLFEQEGMAGVIGLILRLVEEFFVDVFVRSYDQVPQRIILDLDATDDPIHGHQSGSFFHGYYDNYCCLPLYIFCGEHLLCSRLRPSDMDASAGSVKEMDRIVKQIRTSWPEVQIILRGDSGFCKWLVSHLIRQLTDGGL